MIIKKAKNVNGKEGRRFLTMIMVGILKKEFKKDAREREGPKSKYHTRKCGCGISHPLLPSSLPTYTHTHKIYTYTHKIYTYTNIFTRTDIHIQLVTPTF